MWAQICADIGKARYAYHGLNFSAPFIVMRHWNELHQDGQFWCGEFTTDDVMRCFGLSQLIVANTKITRLMKDHLVEKGESFTENGHRRWKYHKTGSMV